MSRDKHIHNHIYHYHQIHVILIIRWFYSLCFSSLFHICILLRICVDDFLSILTIGSNNITENNV